MTSIKYDYSFLAGAYVNDKIFMNEYKFIIHLLVETEDDKDQQIAFHRMDHYITNEIENSIFVCETDTNIAHTLRNVGFNIITIEEPGPIDQMINVTLVTKINNILEDKLSIVEGCITSSRGGYIQYLYHVPDEIDEETNIISIDPSKWWNNGELTNNTKTNVISFHEFSNWRELNLEWSADANPKTDKSKATVLNFPINDNR